jgi:hypothetical protein
MGTEVNLKHSGSQRRRELRQQPGDDVNNYSEHDHIAAYDHQILDGGGYRFAEHLAEAPSVSCAGIQCRLMDSPGQGCFFGVRAAARQSADSGGGPAVLPRSAEESG